MNILSVLSLGSDAIKDFPYLLDIMKEIALLRVAGVSEIANEVPVIVSTIQDLYSIDPGISSVIPEAVLIQVVEQLAGVYGILHPYIVSSTPPAPPAPPVSTATAVAALGVAQTATETAAAVQVLADSLPAGNTTAAISTVAQAVTDVATLASDVANAGGTNAPAGSAAAPDSSSAATNAANSL